MGNFYSEPTDNNSSEIEKESKVDTNLDYLVRDNVVPKQTIVLSIIPDLLGLGTIGLKIHDCFHGDNVPDARIFQESNPHVHIFSCKTGIWYPINKDGQVTKNTDLVERQLNYSAGRIHNNYVKYYDENKNKEEDKYLLEFNKLNNIS